jgi:glycerol-3-phosphate dehydrogenase (NAD(P)+)
MSVIGSSIAVLGSGAWGTALACRLALNGHSVTIWGRDQTVIDQINQSRVTPFLKGVVLPENLMATTSLDKALLGANYILLAVPSSALYDVCSKLASLIDLSNMPVVWATKGIDPTSGLFPDQLLSKQFHVKKMALLSGPSFALEVAEQKPTAINVVSQTHDFQNQLIHDFSHLTFRMYQSNDYIGSQICAIYKNVLAIAAGVCDGKNMGLNARAALLTRGLEEMRRFVVAMGGEEKTVYGLCGLGDLLLTATGDLSRNRQLGLALTRYNSIQEAADSVSKTLEGMANVDWLLRHASNLHVELPICSIVSKILKADITIDQAVIDLLSRERSV